MSGRRKISCRVALCLSLSLLYGLIAGCASQVTSINTRPDVTVKVLLAAPDTDPKGIFLVYPGGLGFLVGGDGRLADRFPRLTHLYTEQGFVVGVVDTPSDQPGGSGNSFRLSKEHAEDARKIIDFVSQKWPKPIFLLGHSSGGASVTYIAATLKDRRIAGIVITSSPAMSALKVPLEQVTSPVLRVHHRDDICVGFQPALRQGSQFLRSSKVHFIEVSGGDRSREWGCGPNDQRMSYAHYFYGKEREVVKAITDWAMEKPVPNRIGP